MSSKMVRAPNAQLRSGGGSDELLGRVHAKRQSPRGPGCPSNLKSCPSPAVRLITCGGDAEGLPTNRGETSSRSFHRHDSRSVPDRLHKEQISCRSVIGTPSQPSEVLPMPNRTGRSLRGAAQKRVSLNRGRQICSGCLLGIAHLSRTRKGMHTCRCPTISRFWASGNCVPRSSRSARRISCHSGGEHSGPTGLI